MGNTRFPAIKLSKNKLQRELTDSSIIAENEEVFGKYYLTKSKKSLGFLNVSNSKISSQVSFKHFIF